MSSRGTARLQLVFAALLFSTGGAAIKATTLTGWQVASFRSGIAALTLLVCVPAARRGWGWRPALVGTAYAATLILFVSANKLTTSANTIFLQATSPIYLLVLGPIFLHEPVRRRELLVVAAVLAGLVLFFIGHDAPMVTAPDPATGNLLALLSGVSFAVTIAGLRWLSRGDGNADVGLATVALGNVIAFLWGLPFALPVLSSTPTDWMIIGYLGAFQIGLAYACLTRGLRQVPALEASLLLMVEPVLNPVWSWLVHGERPSAWALLGGCLIIGATVAMVTGQARQAA
jgi:drug/metabolite transporter (DMT)-like permease